MAVKEPASELRMNELNFGEVYLWISQPSLKRLTEYWWMIMKSMNEGSICN